MKAALYARVSTDEQTTENQVPDLERLAADLKCNEFDLFSEDESAWKSGHQKELARILDYIRSGQRKYDYLLVWALDRLSREGPVRTMGLIAELERYGCHVVTVKERAYTDLSPGIRELMIMLMSWVAQQESVRRSERTIAGQERVRKNGTKSGIGIGKRGKDKPGTQRRRAGYLNRWRGKYKVGEVG